MHKALTIVLILSVILAYGLASAPAEEGAAQKLGEKIDRGLDRLGKELKQGWADAQAGVEKLGVQGRVYSRLHWDKALEKATIDIDVRDTNVVVLKGNVTNSAARLKAVQLAQDTVGVARVVDNLAVAP